MAGSRHVHLRGRWSYDALPDVASCFAALPTVAFRYRDGLNKHRRGARCRRNFLFFWCDVASCLTKDGRSLRGARFTASLSRSWTGPGRRDFQNLIAPIALDALPSQGLIRRHWTGRERHRLRLRNGPRRGVTVHFLTERLVFTGADGDPIQILMFRMMGAFAQFERTVIGSRQREGISAAKAAGNTVEGVPR